MRKQEAIEKFRNPYSCAQTIYAAYAENPTQEGLDNMKNFSGGRVRGPLRGDANLPRPRSRDNAIL